MQPGWVGNEEEKGEKETYLPEILHSWTVGIIWKLKRRARSIQPSSHKKKKKSTLKPAEIYPRCVDNFPKAHGNEKHFILPQICQQWDLGGYCPPHSTAEASAQWVSFSIIAQTFATSVQIEAAEKWKVCIL